MNKPTDEELKRFIEALRQLAAECASMRYREFDRADALRVAASELERLAKERGV